MPAAGCFGLGAEYADLIDVGALGAIVVGPVTAAPRRGAYPPRLHPLPEGVLVHTGLANPGISRVIRQHARTWSRSPVPVIIHVAGTSPDEAAACCHRLAAIDAVAGIELGLPDSASSGDVEAIIQAALDCVVHPLIVRLPFCTALAYHERVVSEGAAALTIAAPPRGTILYAERGFSKQIANINL